MEMDFEVHHMEKEQHAVDVDMIVEEDVTDKMKLEP